MSEDLTNYVFKKLASSKIIEQADSYHDDFYDLLSLNFLANEYRRTKEYVSKLQGLFENQKFLDLKNMYTEQHDRMLTK